MSDQVWYQQGLKFKCTGCGQCCTGSPGYVWVTPEEISQMAQLLNISEEDFSKKYTRKAHGRIALIEKRDLKGNYDCVFLKERKCTLYEARPKQCRTYPWWKENLSSPEEWQETAAICEGINHPEAPLISLSTIQIDLNKTNIDHE